MDATDDLVADLAAADEREIREFLERAESAVLTTLNGFPAPDGGPRFARMLAISALLRLASQLMGAGLEHNPQDYDRYVAMVHELAQRIAPWSPHSGRTH